MIKYFAKTPAIIFLFASVLFISACNQTLPLKVEKPNDTLTFVLPDKYKNQTIAIQDFTVIKTDCEQNCTMWALVNVLDESGALSFAVLEELTIEYGESFEELRVSFSPQELTSGEFSVGGTAVFIDDSGTVTGSKILFADFTLEGISKTLKLE